jgi:uncharacterized protein (DUF58 family)
MLRWIKPVSAPTAGRVATTGDMRLPHGLVHYRPGWKPGGHQAGLVSGISAGMGDRLRAVVPWLEYPDPRRLDVRATLRDPYEKLWVRDFKLDTAIPVIALVDGSASMGYRGVYDRRLVVARILSVLARSAYAAGDAFGMVVANEHIHPQLRLPPKINRSAPLWIQRHWPLYQPQGQSAAGLNRCILTLPKRKALLFVISDFHWPEAQLLHLLKGLAHHDVVPIMLRDPAEAERLPDRGFAQLRDLESAEQVFVWMNRRMRQQIQARAQQHTAWLTAHTRRFGMLPHVVNDDFQPQALTHYFLHRL